MDRNEILDLIIREMTEAALLERRENCAKEEKQLYQEAAVFSQKQQEILGKLPQEDRQGAGGTLCQEQSDCRP